MNSAEYTFLLNQPGVVNDRQTEALEKIVTEFPYFQSARALRLKGLYSQNSFQYNFALKVAAAYTTDRSVLFDFITSDTFTTIQKGLYDQKVAELHGIEVKESEIVIQQNEEPAIDKVEQSILSSIKESEAVSELPGISFDEEEAVIAKMASDNNAEEKPLTPQIPEVDVLEEIEFVPKGQELVQETENQETPEIENLSEDKIQAEPDTVETPEQKLHIGEPLAFSKTETHSFQEWLQLSRFQPIQREEPIQNAIKPDEKEKTGEPETDPKLKKIALIDRFIENNPKIPQIKADVEQVVIAEPKEDYSALMTETLARVYLEQKKYQKAIQAYEILILKYPEKSSFFADRISEIKNLQQNNTL